MYEYRIVPKVWEYRSKVRIYQDEKQFLKYKKEIEKYSPNECRYEVREVGEWTDYDENRTG